MGTGRTLAITASVLAILGTGGYLIYTKLIKPKNEEKAKKKAEEDATKNAQPQQQQQGGGTPSPGNLATTTQPFTSSAEVKAFQDWMDVNYPTWLNGGRLSKGNGYGTFGPSTSNVYETHKQEYCDLTGICPLGLVKSQRLQPTKSTDFNMLQSFLGKWWYKTLYPQDNKLQLSTKNPDFTTTTRTLIDFYINGYGEFMLYDKKSGIQNKIPFNWYFLYPDLYLECGGKTYSVKPGQAVENGYQGIWEMIKDKGFSEFSDSENKTPDSRIFDGTDGQPRTFSLV